MEIHVVDATGEKHEDVTVPGNAAAGRIIPQLVELMGIPTVGPNGHALAYKFHHKSSGRQIGDEETLEAAGVRDGDVLRVVAEMAAGGPARLTIDFSDEPRIAGAAAARPRSRRPPLHRSAHSRGTDLARELADDIERLNF